MVMSIVNNVGSLNAQRSLSKAASSLQSSMGKLSSGSRITRAAEDVAGLGISEKLRGEVRGLNQAARNGEDAISMIQTAEGALEEVHSMLQRIRELAVQASNDTLDTTDRKFIAAEMTELRDQINEVASTTEFNGKKLASGALVTALDATNSGLNVGAAMDNTGITGISVDGAAAGTTFTLTNDVANAEITLTNGTTNVAQTLGHASVNFTAANEAKTVDFNELGVSITLESTAVSTGADVAVALAAAGTVITQAGSGAATFQTGADAGQTIAVSFLDVTIDADNANGVRVTDLHTAITNMADGDPTRADAQDVITDTDAMIEFISETRADYGAKQNRLEHTVNNLTQTAENLTGAESRIRDADVAAESANMAKAAVLQQAAVSVLAQANAQPQLALKLLG